MPPGEGGRMEIHMGYDATAKMATLKYIRDKQQEIKVRYRKEEYEQDVLPAIRKTGLPVATYIKQAVSEKILAETSQDHGLKDTLYVANESTLKGIPAILKDDCRQIILYGSYARGDYTEDSDIDIAILTDSDRAEAKKYSRQLDSLAASICTDTLSIVNYICIPYREYQKKKSWYPFFMNIAREGVVLYER